MKYLRHILIVAILIFSVQVSADDLISTLENLKQLNTEVLGSEKSFPSVRGVEDVNEYGIELDYEGEYLNDVFSYIQEMHEKHPEVLSAEKKEYMISQLGEISDVLVQAHKGEAEKSLASDMASEKLSDLVEELLFVPDNASDDERALHDAVEPELMAVNSDEEESIDEERLMSDTEYYGTDRSEGESPEIEEDAVRSKGLLDAFAAIFEPQNTASRDATQGGTIKVMGANVRSGPGTIFKVIDTLGYGKTVTILSKVSNWYQCTIPGGKTGYIHSSLLNVSAAPSGNTSGNTSGGTRAYVNVNAANVRTGPSTNYRIITTLRRNTQFSIVGNSGGWYLIQMSDSRRGYIYKQLVSTGGSSSPSTPTPTQPSGVTGVVNVSAANVRSGPGTSNRIIATLTHGTQVSILGNRSGWYNVRIPNGNTGYIYSELVRTGTSTGSSNNTTVPAGPKAQRIVQSALGAVNHSDVIYGVDCYTAATEWGNLACAKVVSAILKNAGCNNKIHQACVLLRAHLRDELHWTELGSGNYQAGDVCFWRKRMDDRPRHVGVIVQKDVYGKWWAVDNSSSQRKVLKNPLKRSYYPYVHPVIRSK